MRMIRLMTVAAAALMLAPAAFAQGTAPNGSAWYQDMFAPDLIGKPVRAGSGDQLGKIEEIARDSASGDLVAVVKSGGFFGIGGDQKIVPLAEIQKKDAEFVVPQGSKQKFSSRPDFDKAKHPPVTHFSKLGVAAK